MKGRHVNGPYGTTLYGSEGWVTSQLYGLLPYSDEILNECFQVYFKKERI